MQNWFKIPWNLVLYENSDQTLPNSLNGLLNCEIGGLDCHVITTEYRTRVHCLRHMWQRLSRQRYKSQCYIFTPDQFGRLT